MTTNLSYCCVDGRLVSVGLGRRCGHRRVLWSVVVAQVEGGVRIGVVHDVQSA